MKIIDAHSHIDYITHLVQTDVVGTVCNTVQESEWQSLIDITKCDNKIYCAFGVHPWFVDFVQFGFENRLQDLLKTNRSYMVGEIGLDKYKPDMEKQIEIFKVQFDIAVNLKRIVFLHCVGAWDKIFHILKQYKKFELPIIIVHDFNGSDSILQNLLNNYNVFFSIHKIDKHQEINRIQQIPCDKILVETDAKSNIVLSELINKISEIKQESKMCDIIYNNTLRMINHG